MDRPLRILQYGLGPIGQAVARTLLQKQHTTGTVQLVGAVDIDPAKVGRDVADLMGDSQDATGIRVSDDPEQVLAEAAPDAVIHTTTSFLDGVQEQLLRCLEAGAHVVSSTEELAFPYERHPERADVLDRAARQAGVALVGTGVNPGYAMDTLPLTATGACTSVESVRVQRVVDAGERRAPLQQKVGAGLSPAAFAEKKAGGGFGHIGLRESLRLIADGLGWSLEGIEETLQPVRAERAHETPYVAVAPGEVAGIHHVARGQVGGQPRLHLDLQMYVGAEQPRDAVQVVGEPPIDLTVDGGIFGDTATVGMLVNTVPRLLDAAPGLRTMPDLPLPRAIATRP